MKNEVHNSIIADKSYQNFKIALGLSIVPILYGTAILIDPNTYFVFLLLTPIWGLLLLIAIIISSTGIVEGRKLLKKNEPTPKTKISIYGNAVILAIGLLISILFIITLSGESF